MISRVEALIIYDSGLTRNTPLLTERRESRPISNQDNEDAGKSSLPSKSN